MKSARVILAAGLLAGFCAALLPARADSRQLSPERLDVLDQRGYLPPEFKSAVRELVNTLHSVEEAKAERLELERNLPDLKKQQGVEEAKAVALRAELAKYEHPDETDFIALQAVMNDASAHPEDQLALAQAYVWAYPAGPHEPDAQQYLAQVQKKIADQTQAEKDAAAARVAAHQKLVQEAQARQLNLIQWRDFLRDMSQDDLLKYIGRPTSQDGDYWIYSGEWILDPATNRKVGMEINFNAGRVLNVTEAPTSP